MNIFLTGASGFVGSALLRALKDSTPHRVTLGLRREDKALSELADNTLYWDLCADTPPDLHGIDCVIHAAARVHQLQETATDPLAAFRAVNCAGTLMLARAAMAAGVKRFVFVSSIHVNGHERAQSYTAFEPPRPTDPYGISKWEAEQALRALGDTSAHRMEIVIVRPPLVYGVNAPGNFGRLAGAVARGLPLPFARIANRRSLVAVDNLVDLLMCCAGHPAAAGETFLVSDDQDFSTPELIRALALGMGVKARLFPVPVWLLRVLLGALGKRALFQRLGGSLAVDIVHTKTRLGWSPKVRPDEVFARLR